MSLIAFVLSLSTPPAAVLAEGESVEVERQADLNRDGVPDLAYVVRADDRRELRVVVSGPKPAPQILPLDPYPLVDGTLKISGNVLSLDDLSGGTTAVLSTHRFRWDAKLRAIRLIGLDATLYSRTLAHDGHKASWNLLTGTLRTHTMQLRNDDSVIAYDEINHRRRIKRSKPLRLEQSPDGPDLLGWPDSQR